MPAFPRRTFLGAALALAVTHHRPDHGGGPKPSPTPTPSPTTSAGSGYGSSAYGETYGD